MKYVYQRHGNFLMFTKDMLDEKGQARNTRVYVTL